MKEKKELVLRAGEIGQSSACHCKPKDLSPKAQHPHQVSLMVLVCNPSPGR